MHEGVHELCDGSLENENLFVGSLDGIEWWIWSQVELEKNRSIKSMKQKLCFSTSFNWNQECNYVMAFAGKSMKIHLYETKQYAMNLCSRSLFNRALYSILIALTTRKTPRIQITFISTPFFSFPLDCVFYIIHGEHISRCW